MNSKLMLTLLHNSLRQSLMAIKDQSHTEFKLAQARLMAFYNDHPEYDPIKRAARDSGAFKGLMK